MNYQHSPLETLVTAVLSSLVTTLELLLSEATACLDSHSRKTPNAQTLTTSPKHPLCFLP